jgi:sugar O-acyltransferase (sialic acid O-acetyltransferase NeuD family)
VKNIGIIGFGSLGRQILGLLSASRPPDGVALFDDALHQQGRENAFPFDGFLEDPFVDYDFYVGLGYRHLPRKAEILRQLIASGRSVPSFVHPSCQVHPTCRIGQGCLIYPLCNLDQEVELGHGVLLNNSVVVSHNSRIGDAVYCSPGVVLSGHVTIGEAAFLGSGTVVSNHCRVGIRARIGIGSVVARDVPNEASAIGNPLRLLGVSLELE